MKHLKKLAMVIAGLWCCMAVSAHDFEVDGIYYNILTTTEVGVTFRGSSSNYSGEYTGKVEIPETVTYNGKTYSVTSIGRYAFLDCTGLASITIPNSVTSIGENAIRGCTGLTSITVDAGNAVYDSRENCNAIIEKETNSLIGGCRNTTIPNSVTSIGRYAFYGCTRLASITIPNSVTSIGGCAFEGCTGLASIIIPNSVTSIGSSAFDGCSGLASINIPNSVTSIESCAFYKCTGLTSITIPNSVTSIGYSAFSECTGLASINIPNSVTSIGYSAFSECTGLASITIPNSVTSIGGCAFDGCSGLASITIPNSVTSIERYAFYGCSGLASITIPNSVTSIGEGAFDGCTGLTSITIPNSVTSIEMGAFDGCTGLKTVINSSSLHISAGSANHGYVAYYANYVINADEQIGDFFFYNTALVAYVGDQSELALPEDYNGEKYMIGPSAFRDNKNLASVFIPASVTGIEENAFNGCGNLASLTMASPVPPASVYENSFGTINYIYTTLYVPEGSLAAYQTADVWKYFLEIKEYDPTGIEDVVLDTESSNLPVYNLQGVRMKDMNNLPSGIYIQGGKKFIVK